MLVPIQWRTPVDDPTVHRRQRSDDAPFHPGVTVSPDPLVQKMGCGSSTHAKAGDALEVKQEAFTLDKGFLDADYDGRPEVHLENYVPAKGVEQTFTTKPVCVTGVSGFLGGHLVAQLIDAGYTVHGTVRRPTDHPRYKKLAALSPRLKLFRADLLLDEGWDAAVAGCEYVLHNAGPFVMAVEKAHSGTMIDAHVKGAERVLGACGRAGVKRVVMTSSMAAIVNHSKVRDTTFSEADWNTESGAENDPYFYAKRVAEERGRALAKEKGIEFVSINPGGICGPAQDSYTKLLCGAHLMGARPHRTTRGPHTAPARCLIPIATVDVWSSN